MGAGITGMGVSGVAAPPEVKLRRVVATRPAAEGRRPRRARRRVQAPAGAVQPLFQACRAVFRGPDTVPALTEVALLGAILDGMIGMAIVTGAFGVVGLAGGIIAAASSSRKK